MFFIFRMISNDNIPKINFMFAILNKTKSKLLLRVDYINDNMKWIVQDKKHSML